MFRGLRKHDDGEPRPPRPDGARPRKRAHNLFEAAAVYVAADVEHEETRAAEAESWVSPEALSFGVTELACRAVIALAREWDVPPLEVTRRLLNLPSV